MKCPLCGYYNLPGVEVCSQCRGTRTTAQVSGIQARHECAVEEIYPPRARDRTLAVRVGEQLRRPARPIRALADPIRGIGGLAPAVRPWLITCASLLPGLGQWLDGRRGTAAVLFGLAIVLIAGLVGTIRHPFSQTLLLLLLGLVWYSVWDAARHGFPPTFEGQGAGLLRLVRMGLLSASIVLFSVAGCGVILARWYGLWRINTQQLAPAFLWGDGLIVQRLDQTRTPLRPGDLIIDRADGAPPFIERVIAVPGDQIALRGTALWVNGRPLPPGHLPLAFAPPAFPFMATVPPRCVGLWNQAAADGGTPLLMLPEAEIDGRVIAVYDPPHRRRWLP